MEQPFCKPIHNWLLLCYKKPSLSVPTMYQLIWLFINKLVAIRIITDYKTLPSRTDLTYTMASQEVYLNNTSTFADPPAFILTIDSEYS